MRLHYHPISPFSRKALVAVYYRKDPIECELVEAQGEALRTEEFLALSPFGTLPVLETPDGPIFESTSIIEYLEEKGPRKLLPPKQARLARHFDRLGDLHLLPAQYQLFQGATEEAADKARLSIHTAWDIFAKALEDHPFVCGDAFTLGDIGPAIATDYLERLGETPPLSIIAWKERCFAVPAMEQALQEALPFIAAIAKQRANS